MTGGGGRAAWRYRTAINGAYNTRPPDRARGVLHFIEMKKIHTITVRK